MGCGPEVDAMREGVMIFSRQRLEQIENETLAPYGMRSRNSRGRVYPEDEHPYRTAYQRDHDRIVHTTAFRRLKHKTQVFVAGEGDANVLLSSF